MKWTPCLALISTIALLGGIQCSDRASFPAAIPWQTWPEFVDADAMQPPGADEIVYVTVHFKEDDAQNASSTLPVVPGRLNLTQQTFEPLREVRERNDRVLAVDWPGRMLLWKSQRGNVSLWEVDEIGPHREMFVMEAPITRLKGGWVSRASEQVLLWGRARGEGIGPDSRDVLVLLTTTGELRWRHTLAEGVEVLDARPGPKLYECVLWGMDRRYSQAHETEGVTGSEAQGRALMHINAKTGEISHILQDVWYEAAAFNPLHPIAMASWLPGVHSPRNAIGLIAGDLRWMARVYSSDESYMGFWRSAHEVYLLKFAGVARRASLSWAIWDVRDDPLSPEIQWFEVSEDVANFIVLRHRLALTSRGNLVVLGLEESGIALTPICWGGASPPAAGTIPLEGQPIDLQVPTFSGHL